MFYCLKLKLITLPINYKLETSLFLHMNVNKHSATDLRLENQVENQVFRTAPGLWFCLWLSVTAALGPQDVLI